MTARIDSLGDCCFQSNLHQKGAGRGNFKNDSDRIVCDDRMNESAKNHFHEPSPTFEIAGPRGRVYFDSAKTTAAIVTCGGLCPGLNDVIRGIVMELWHGYGVTNILTFLE